MTSKIATESADKALRVVSAEAKGPKIYVTIEGDSVDRLLSSEASELAYQQRMSYGAANAGIEPLGGTYITVPEDGKKKAAKRTWRRDYVLTQMI